MLTTSRGFDLRRDHGFRNPPFLPSMDRAAPPSIADSSTFNFRRPPTTWRAPNRRNELKKTPRQDAAHVAEEAVSSSHGWSDESARDISRNVQHNIDVDTPASEGGCAIAVDFHEEGAELEYGDLEEAEREWVLSPEWAEYLSKSPSVQRYLQRMEGKEGLKREARGRRAKAGTSDVGGRRKDSTRNVKNKRKGMPAKLGSPQESADALEAKSGLRRPSGEDARQAADANAAEQAAAAAKEQLELAKIRAHALLYAGENRDRQVSDGADKS